MGIRYVIPKGTGIHRHRHGKTFRYTSPDGKQLSDSATLDRIRALVIPPAWESVWISPSADSHIQAVGRDARGRKQYRYHPEFRKVRDMVKFDRMREFGKLLPKIRRVVGRDLNKPGISKQKIVAAVVRLLETTYIRIGNEEYAEENGSFGLTTFRNRHVTILGEVLKFRFRGKSGQNHDIQLKDKRLARILRRCKDIPGSALFQYLDADGTPQSINSDDVNDYIRNVTGGEFTAKDFRTWGGTCLAADYFMSKCQDVAPTKSAVVEVVKNVAEKLGNRPATCRKYYIHPTVMDCYMSGHLEKLARKFEHTRSIRDYEQIVLSLLKPLKKSLLRAS
jgi:DNA topoisomerase-1